MRNASGVAYRSAITLSQASSDVGAAEHPAAYTLGDCLVHEIRRHRVELAVHDGAKWRRDGDRAHPFERCFVEVGVVEDQTVGNAQPSRIPRRGYRQVSSGRQCVGQSVKRERRFVAEYAFAIGPEPWRHQIFMLSGWKAAQPEHAPASPFQSARTQVVLKQWARKAGFVRLRDGEVTELRAGECEVAPGIRD